MVDNHVKLHYNIYIGTVRKEQLNHTLRTTTLIYGKNKP